MPRLSCGVRSPTGFPYLTEPSPGTGCSGFSASPPPTLLAASSALFRSACSRIQASQSSTAGAIWQRKFGCIGGRFTPGMASSTRKDFPTSAEQSPQVRSSPTGSTRYSEKPSRASSASCAWRET